MKIEGESIKKVADQAEGAGKTAEPLLHAADNVMGEVGRRLVHGMSRKARIVQFKEAPFENADDWTSSEDGAVTVSTSVTGGTTVDLSEPIEFIHFGRVYLDRSHLFPSPTLDDTAAALVPIAPAGSSTLANPPNDGKDIPAHGLMFRAALLRESVLLGGFIRAQMDALIAEEKSKGVIGVLAQVLADLTGSGGGTDDKPNAVDLNPHLKKVIEAAKRINKDKIDYVELHASGIELHIARRAYREYLVTENEKRHAPAKTAKPGGGILNDQVPLINQGLSAGHDWLGGGKNMTPEQKQDAVPKLTALVPPGVQDFLSLVQKISFKAWDVCAALNYEYAIRLEPIIEDAARRMSIESIQKRAIPVFPVWYMERQPDYQLPADVEQKIFDKVDNPLAKKDVPKLLGFLVDPINKAVDVVTDPIKGALQDFDNKVGIDKTLDFLSRPDRYTPGRPFLDDIFLIPPDEDPPDVPDAAKRARVGWSSGLGQMAVDSLKGALGISHIPEFLEFIFSKVSTICAEFVRAVYCRLLTLKPTDQITEAEIQEAAKRHFVGNIIETILAGLGFVDKLRSMTLDIPIAEVAISTDALIGRAKEFAATKLEKWIDPVVKYAMRDLYQMIFAHRQTAVTNRALTMEVHLAQLPTVFSRMFRNVFFPLWDKVIERTIEGITASLAPRLPEAGMALLKAREQGEQVRGKIVQALAALDSLPGKLPDAEFKFGSPKNSVDKLKKDWNPIVKNAQDAWDAAEIDVTQDLPALEHDELETAFPVKDRVKKVLVARVTPEHLKKVSRELKWKRPKPPVQGSDAAGSGSGKPSDVKNQAPQGPAGTGSSPPPSGAGTPSQQFPYGDYPLAKDQPMYASATPYAGSYAPGGSPNMPMHSPGSYPPPPPSGNLYLASAPPKQGMPSAPISNGGVPEQTMQLDNLVSPELRDLAQLDVEETAALDAGSLASVLPPFLGPTKKV